MRICLLQMVAVLWPSLSLLGGLYATETLRVRDFGAVGDGQSDDGPAIRKALAAAERFRRPVVVRFEFKTYRIGPRYDRWCALVLEGAQHITLDGQGCTLLLHPDNRALLLYRCKDVAVRDFNIDFDPLPFTQGDVVRIDRASKEMLLRIHEGFPLPDKGIGRHGAFLTKGERRYTHRWFYIDKVRCVSREERLYALTAKKGFEKALLEARVGQRFVFPVTYRFAENTSDSRFVVGQGTDQKGVFLSNPAATFQVRFSRACVFENINVYASPAMVFRLTGTEDTVLRNVRIQYKPGTSRLMVSASDGMHCKDNKTGPLIENCFFEGLLDDSINVSTMSETIIKKLSDRTFITDHSDILWYDTPLSEGDVLQVFDPVKGKILGEVKAVQVAFVHNRRRRLTIDRPLPDVVDANSVGLERATRFFIKKVKPAIIRHCVFKSQMKTAMVLRTPVICEDNQVEKTAYGVNATNSPRFGEGPVPYDQVYKNNRFEDCWIGGIVAGRLALEPNSPPSGGPILIEGNTFVQGPGHGVEAFHLRDVTIRKCKFVMRPDADPRYRAIRLNACKAVTVCDCEIDDSRPTVRDVIQIENMRDGDAMFLHNVFRLFSATRDR